MNDMVEQRVVADLARFIRGTTFKVFAGITLLLIAYLMGTHFGQSKTVSLDQKIASFSD